MYSLKQKSTKNKVTSSRSKRQVAAVVFATFLVAGTGAAWVYARRNTAPLAVEKNPVETINYTPTSPVEKKETEDHKETLIKELQAIKQNSSNPTGTSGKKSVIPTITDASSTTVRAYVTGVFEEGGTCMATLTKDGVTKTKSAPAFGNASYTQCEPIELDNGFLSSGNWQLVVSYTSNTAQGSSTSREVRVP